MSEGRQGGSGEPGSWALRTLFWEATLNCNAHCAFCGSRCGEKRQPDLDAALIRRAFRQTAEAYDPARIMIHVTGGEPLLRRDLFSVMEYADALGFPWGMVTNGTRITEEAVREMKRTHLRTVSLSLDGPAAYHEAVRRLPGGFDALVRGLNRLREADFLDCLQVTTVVTRQNLPLLEELFAFLYTQPIDSWRIAPVDPIGRGQDQRDLLLGPEELERLFAFLDAHQFCENFAVTTSCSHYLGPWDTRYRDHPFRCGAGRQVASILANGDLFVCPNVPRRPEWIQGNIERDCLPEVWERGYGWFRDPDRRKKGPCAACPAWEACGADSLHTWDPEAEEPRFCPAEQLPRPEEHGTGELSWPEEHGTGAAPWPEDGAPGTRAGWPLPRKDTALPPKLRPVVLGGRKPLRGVKLSYGSSSERLVYWLPEAAEQLAAYFQWGARHPSNLCEQMAGMIGHLEGNTAYVEGLTPVFLESRGAAEAAFSEESRRRTLEELALWNRNRPAADSRYRLFSGPFRLLGYVHSHPGDLPPELSRPDREWRRILEPEFPEGPILGIVNPQRRDLCLFWDSAYAPVDAILLTEADQTDRWQ